MRYGTVLDGHYAHTTGSAWSKQVGQPFYPSLTGSILPFLNLQRSTNINIITYSMNNASIFTGKLILILGPSGCGKGTSIKYLKKTHPEYAYPISHTTRPPRKNEKDGENYHFISKDEFKQKIKAGYFLEWAQVHQDNYYGTDKAEILNALKKGKTIIREIDIQGAQSASKLIPKRNLSKIFISTKSWSDLEERIRNRSSISKDEINKRHNSYKLETKYANKCEHTIFTKNGDPGYTNKIIEDIIAKEIS